MSTQTDADFNERERPVSDEHTPCNRGRFVWIAIRIENVTMKPRISNQPVAFHG